MTRARKQRPARRRRLTLSTWCTLPTWFRNGMDHVLYLGGITWIEAKAECKQRLGFKDKPR